MRMIEKCRRLARTNDKKPSIILKPFTIVQAFGRLGGDRATMDCDHGHSCVGEAYGPPAGRISGLLPSRQDDSAHDRYCA